MNTIKHNVVVAQQSIIEQMYRVGALNWTTYIVLLEAEKCGGFIAGGFASLLARMVIGHHTFGRSTSKNTRAKTNVSVMNKADQSIIREYLYSRYTRKDMQRNVGEFITMGDIDVWFPDRHSASMFMERCGQSCDIDRRPTRSGFGAEFLCYDNGTRCQVVQAILKRTGSIQEITGGFDIYNAACAIKGHELFIPEGFEHLCETRTLHIANIDNNYILSRMSKWM